ncbi:AAA family ATPase [Micromonospora sp. LOL_023]|uniref:MinD/ParA family ATP-binding protein n=1 Tax=Micromonospora sp. LOL_023 TaxID=3345418 RepID=UPI003A842A6E
MDGTETGWGRPAEPAPRWRALLDRARLAGRTGENPEIAERNAEVPQPRDSRRGAAPVPNGVAPPPGYRPDEGQPPSPGWPADQGHPADQRQPGGRQPAPAAPEPGPSRYAVLAAPGGYAPNYPVMPGPTTDRGGYPPQPGYPAPEQPAIFAPSAPVMPAQPGALAGPQLPRRGEAEPGQPPPSDAGGYPAQIEWRESRPDAEVDRAVGVLRRNLGMPRVLAFANPKGGVHKTTATVLAAATIGSVRGRGVLAWDDNELRGTLGLRAGSARHARTIRHLISDLMEIENSHGYELTDRLDDYLRHASDGSYDVLAGEESPRFAQRLDPQTVRRVLELLRRTHDVICVDTGNNVESANWQTVLQAADQLVVTCVPREDAAFTADWMLDLLHDVGMGDLVENAVTLLSCPTPGPAPLLEDLRRHFATRTRAVAVVPYDPALETGSSIEYVQLLPETRQAWLQAASIMLEPFVR